MPLPTHLKFVSVIRNKHIIVDGLIAKKPSPSNFCFAAGAYAYLHVASYNVQIDARNMRLLPYREYVSNY